MATPEHARLTVPAPWGLPIMLGLQATWPAPGPVAAGTRLEVWHGPSAGDFSKVLAWCQAAIREQRPGLDLGHLISPWSLVLPDQFLGSVLVAGCDSPSGKRYLHQLRLAEPRPVWAASRAPKTAPPPEFQAQAPRQPAGPLFEGRP